MARLLRPDEYAGLTAFFATLILEQTGGQVVQSATARLVAQHAAHGDDPALHSFVRRWTTRILLIGGIPALVVVVLAPFVRVGSFSPFAVATLGVTLFLAAALTFTLGLLQGLARFGWFGSVYIAMALARLVIGVGLVLLFSQVQTPLRPQHGAFLGAGLALLVGALSTLVPLGPLFRAARGTTHEIHVARAEVRFFLLAAVIFLAYAALTFVDGLIAPLRIPAEAGAYAGAITMAKVILFAPIAVGFILLERVSNADALGRDPDRYLFAALGFVLVTSGAVAVAYLVAPVLLTEVIVGTQYPLTATLIGPYGIAALSNALLSLWVAYFVGRGKMAFGGVLAVAVVVEVALLVALGRDAATMVRVVVAVSLAMQAVALAIFGLDRLGRRSRTP
jgi:O-antigen/teichoic acid export membrane protein